MSDGLQIFVIVLLLLLIIALVCVGPFFTVWSLNTLFALEIPYNFKSWVAMLWIHTILHGIRTSFKRTSQEQNNQ